MFKVKLKTQCLVDSILSHLQVKKEGNTNLIWPIKQSYSTLLGTVVYVGPYVISASQIIYLKTGANPVVLITLQMQDDGQKSEERNNPNVIEGD